MVDSAVRGQDFEITLRYKGPCRRASGDLRYSWQVDGKVVSDSELFSAGITRDLPPIERGAERTTPYLMPFPPQVIEAVIITLDDCGCGVLP